MISDERDEVQYTAVNRRLYKNKLFAHRSPTYRKKIKNKKKK